jgi:2-dehydropantoate 2-reductase
MRILVVGAGAIGGYFGGRLLEAGQDVTFLVRRKRADELFRSGLTVRSPAGDMFFKQPPTILAEDVHDSFDLVLLSCKAYDLEGAVASFAPAVGPATQILPLLNGMRHLDYLDARFGRARVLGGRCLIAASLNENGEVLHLNENHELSFGERDEPQSIRIPQIADAMEGARMIVHVSRDIILDMWSKWVFLASLAASTCLMRASVGDILSAPRGLDLLLGFIDECSLIAAQEGFPLPAHSLDQVRRTLTDPGSSLTSSMLRDVEKNGRIEADHIVGDLLLRMDQTSLADKFPLLRLAYTHLKAYETRRMRTLSAGSLARG